MELTVSTEREDDGRWLAEVPELPGVMAYGATQELAMRAVQVLALRVLADCIEQLKIERGPVNFAFPPAA